VQAEFLRTCHAGAGGTKAAVAPCECALKYLEAHLSQRSLEVLERSILKGEAKVPQTLREAGASCEKK
jgi:hypothetical protein